MKPINTFRARFNTVTVAGYSLTQKYLATRAHWPTMPAHYTLARVRAVIAGETAPQIKNWVKDWRPDSAYNPRITERVGYSQREILTAKRWIENTKRAGLRFVGYADELGACKNTGWYTDSDCYETLRGAVWQLPARNGCAVYVSGYEDPNNNGAAFIDFDPTYGEPGGHGAGYFTRDDEARREAGRAADSIAERHSEEMREDSEKYQAAQRVETMRETLCELRRRHSALIRAIFDADHTGDNAIGARIREETRDRVAETVREIRDTVGMFGKEILTDYI